MRIEGIQQRASFILGATGITTAGVLANGGLLYGREAFPALGMRIVVGVLLVAATVGLAVAAYAGGDDDHVRACSAELPLADQRRMGSLDRREEPRYVLAMTLLAAQRAEAVGDWKIRQLKRARRSFAASILFVVLANLSLLFLALLA